MIGVIDYGLGNVRAFLNVYRRLNIDATAIAASADLDRATKLVLPGVGSFDHAVESLEKSGMRDAIEDLVMRRHLPVLGVCVGMQMLGMSSEEGVRPGLGWIKGTVRRFSATAEGGVRRLPHMGWNDVRPQAREPLFENLQVDAKFYFLHSYYFECARSSDVAATATYDGDDFCAAVSAGNVFGVQFHPEKSHHFGMRLLRNFAEL